MQFLTTLLTALAFLLAVAATVHLLTAPLYQYVETALTETGEQTIRGTATLVEANGTWVVYQLAGVTLVSGIPLLTALVRPVLQRPAAWVSGLLLLAYSICGSFTIGLAYMPSAVLLLIAAVLTHFTAPQAGQESPT